MHIYVQIVQGSVYYITLGISISGLVAD